MPGAPNAASWAKGREKEPDGGSASVIGNPEGGGKGGVRKVTYAPDVKGGAGTAAAARQEQHTLGLIEDVLVAFSASQGLDGAATKEWFGQYRAEKAAAQDHLADRDTGAERGTGKRLTDAIARGKKPSM